MTSRPRYEILDGLRGVAAIGVMFFHLSILGLHISYHGYLAVDFFFILSGFVLAHAYADKDKFISLRAFFITRMIRILPLSLFGLLFGTSYFVIRHLTQSQSLYSIGDILSGTFFNIFLLPKPWVTAAPTDTIFPTNTPLWSLSLEVLANLIWFSFLIKAKSSILTAISIFSSVVLFIIIMYYGTADIGATWATYIGGVARVIFGFFTGVLIWHHRPQPIKSDLYAVLSTIMLISVLASPDLGPVFDIVAIVIILPSVVLIASSTNLQSERYAFRFLGNISYPLYSIHVPIFMLTAGFSKKIMHGEHNFFIPIISVSICLLFALILDKLYDRPLRRMLGKVFIP